MKAHELYSYLKSLDGGWVNQEKTVDTFKSGNPDTEVSGIAVGWMSYTWALKQAIQSGCNVFVTHEPTYYDHYDNIARNIGLPGVGDKQSFIDASGLIILRCHDLWDQMPVVGIPDSWGEWLGLGKPIDGTGYYRIFDVSGKTAFQMAQQIAQCTRPFGQEAVALIGPPGKEVTRVSIGTGAITSFFECIKSYKVDLAICTDDGIACWRDGGYAIDMGLPMIVVNHAVSEEAGLMNLAKFLQKRFPNIPVHHIAQQCMYQLVK